MKDIIFDASWDNAGGIGRFSRNVSSRLNGIKVRRLVADNPASPFATLSLCFKLLWLRPETVILPCYIPPLFSFCNFIMTVHDLNHLDRLENSSFLRRVYYSFIIRRGVLKAKKVFTVSDFSRNRIIEWSGVDSNKVINVGNGVDASFNPSVAPIDLGYKYFLCVSNRKLHKNEHLLIKAFSQSEIDPDIKLVFTGFENAELKELISTLCISHRVVFMGSVAETDLPKLYKGALGLLFPSLYEGFGLPVVEAMACGIPVLTSNTTSLPEVAGDAALLVNPDSLPEVRAGIERLFLDRNYCALLIDRGLERARLFSWEAVAEQVQTALDEVE